MDRRFAAAVAKAELRLLQADGAAAQTVMDTTGELEILGPEHAMDGPTTLCGLPEEKVVVMRHLWWAHNATACQACTEAFSGSSPMPEDVDTAR